MSCQSRNLLFPKKFARSRVTMYHQTTRGSSLKIAYKMTFRFEGMICSRGKRKRGKNQSCVRSSFARCFRVTSSNMILPEEDQRSNVFVPSSTKNAIRNQGFVVGQKYLDEARVSSSRNHMSYPPMKVITAPAQVFLFMSSAFHCFLVVRRLDLV
jgi:hypothetical protein